MIAESNKPKKKVSFNKFFPKENSFIKLDGGFKEAEDWWTELTIQTGTRDSICIWASEWQTEESIKQLKAMLEATQKALDFAEECYAIKKPVVKKTPVKKK